MTYHLASLRLRSIGERSARFSDLTLDLTTPGGPAAMSDVPSDSIVWLRNGGGKSSLMSLFYALLLPHANDFMGRAVKRSLTDYVDSGDTSHTIAVWHPADSPTLLGDPEQVLVTGAIYEWHDLRRPADPDKDRDRLSAHYYAFFAVPGVIDADSLPLAGADGQPLRRATVIARLRELATEHVAMDLTLPRNQREWTEQLQVRGIDPELFRRQKEMNHVEGGVEDLFRFASAREFIDFLLDLTVPPDEVTPVADRLAKIADTLALRPAKTLERDFCREAAITLERIGTAHRDIAGSADELASARSEAAELAASFAATSAAAQASAQRLAGQGAVIQEILDQARSRAGVAADLEHLYRHHAAALRVEDVRAAHADVRGAADRAAVTTQAWRLTQRLAEQVQLEEQLAQVRAEASTERAETAPLREARDRRAGALADRLSSLAVHAAAEASAARTRAATHAEESESRRKAADQARDEISAATTDVATARTHLGELENALNSAVGAGWLPRAGADPEVEHSAQATLRAERQEELGDVRARPVARREQRAKLASWLQQLSGERTSADGERARTARDLAGLQERARQIVAHARIQDLAEATADAPVDVWAEMPALMRRLADEIRRADEDLIRLEATRLDEQRSLDAQSRTGLLPTSLDAARVLAALTEHKVPAEAGWAHLRSAWPQARLASALTHPDLARLGCGVVVPADRVAAAASVLAALGTVTTSLVGVYSAAAADQVMSGFDGAGAAARAGAGAAAGLGAGIEPSWTGLHPGLVDASAAESAAGTIRQRLASDDSARAQTVHRRDADRTLLTALDGLLRDGPDGHAISLERRIAEFDAALEQLDLSRDRARDDLDDLEHADVADAERERQLLDEIAAIGETLRRLRSLADRAAAAPAWRELLTGATERRLAAQADADRHSRLEREAHQARAAAEQSAKEAESTAAERRAEAARVEFLEPRASAGSAGAADAGPAVPLDTLRQLFREADAAYQHRVSTSVLAERERGLTGRFSAVAAEVSLAGADVRERAGGLLRTPDGQSEESRRRAIARAQQEQTAADTAVGSAQSQIDAAQRTLDELVRRRALPVRALPSPAASPAAAESTADEHARERDEAELAVKDAVQQIETLRVDVERVQARAQTFEFLLDGLPAPVSDLAEAGDLAPTRSAGSASAQEKASPAEPFDGDDAEARSERRAVIEALTTALDRHRQADGAFALAVGAVRTVGARFSSVTTTARERIVNDSAEALATSAPDLAQMLSMRATVIDEELASIASDQLIVTTSLAHLVSDTLDTLRKAERYSKLPDSLGPWAGKQMLRIAFDAPSSDTQLNRDIDEVIDECIAEGVKPQGLPLLKRAVHKAAGARGFRVKVLKPTQDVAATSEDITRLGKWSGGEKLTVCVAIYCTLAALRARNTGRGNASGGVLMLDNPIGRASHGSLVRLQRDVAAAHGVQLIYTTGVKDPDAISRFPNVIRLDNRPGRTRNRRFIVPSPTADPATDPAGAPAASAGASAEPEVRTVTGARVAHTEPVVSMEHDATIWG